MANLTVAFLPVPIPVVLVSGGNESLTTIYPGLQLANANCYSTETDEDGCKGFESYVFNYDEGITTNFGCVIQLQQLPMLQSNRLHVYIGHSTSDYWLL